MKKAIFALILGLVLSPALLSAQVTQGIDPVVTTTTTTSCLALTYNMGPGSQDAYTNGQVTLLQNFLVSRGYGNFPGRATYGPLTFAAVQNFQQQNGISPVGLIGPVTRAKIASVTCGNVSNNISISSISPASGAIGTQITLTGSGFMTTGYALNSSSNNSMPVCIPMPSGFSGSCYNQQGANTIYLDNFPALKVDTSADNTITFNIPYQLNLSPGIVVLPGPLMVKVSNSNGTSNVVNFNVTSSSNNQNPNITSISPSSGSVGTAVTIYGSGFTRSNIIKLGSYSLGTYDTDPVAYNQCLNGSPCSNLIPVPSITFKIPQYAGLYCPPGTACPALAAQITAGTYPVSVVNDNGTSNSVNFTVNAANNGTPVISGVSGPTTLGINETGTWTVSATDPQNGNLSYLVNWGDNYTCNSYYGSSCASGANSASLPSFQQSATFSHAYSSAGTYTPTFTVRNNSGQQTQTSITVNVGSSYTPPCCKSGPPYSSLSSLSPQSGSPGTQVTIYGSGFTNSGNIITFGGGKVQSGASDLYSFSSPDGQRLTFTVPSRRSDNCSSNGACTNVYYPPYSSGQYQVNVTNAGGASSNSLNFYLNS